MEGKAKKKEEQELLEKINNATEQFMAQLPQKYRTQNPFQLPPEDQAERKRLTGIGRWPEKLPVQEALAAVSYDLQRLEKKMNHHAVVAIKKGEAMSSELDALQRGMETVP